MFIPLVCAPRTLLPYLEVIKKETQPLQKNDVVVNQKSKLLISNFPQSRWQPAPHCEDKLRESSIGVDVKCMGLSIGNVECAGGVTSGAN